MKNILLIALLLVSLIMIYLGISKSLPPPLFTGIGFIIIAILFWQKK